MLREIYEIYFLTLGCLFSVRDTPSSKGGVYLASEKISLRMEKELLLMLMEKYGADNQSEAIRLAVVDCLSANDSPRLKTLFPYVGKKPPRIGKEVAEAFRQSGCSIFVDLFGGSLAMLCYLPWDVKVVVNDINGNLTNMYTVIRDQPSVFVSELMKLPYSEVLFQQFHEELNSKKSMTKLERAVAYYYVCFGACRGRVDCPLFQFSTGEDSNRAERYQKNLKYILALSKRLQSVVILNRDFRKVLQSFNKKNVFIYADCPYLGTEDYYEYVFVWHNLSQLVQVTQNQVKQKRSGGNALRESRECRRCWTCSNPVYGW